MRLKRKRVGHGKSKIISRIRVAKGKKENTRASKHKSRTQKSYVRRGHISIVELLEVGVVGVCVDLDGGVSAHLCELLFEAARQCVRVRGGELEAAQVREQVVVDERRDVFAVSSRR